MLQKKGGFDLVSRLFLLHDRQKERKNVASSPRQQNVAKATAIMGSGCLRVGRVLVAAAVPGSSAGCVPVQAVRLGRAPPLGFGCDF